MRELVIAGYGVSVRARRGLLLITSREGRREVSPADLDAVIVATGGVSISSKAVRLLMSHGVDLVFLDSRGRPLGRVYPPFINRTVATRRAQYAAYNTWRRWEVVAALVEAKLRNQANLLRYYAKSRGLRELRDCAAEVLDALEGLPAALGNARAVLNVEARAARAYWSGVAFLLPAELGFDGRDPDSPDPMNVCLNYAYALLYSQCWRALTLAGLDPYAGFLHADRSGKESLVYDYSDQFKPPAVDRLLIRAFSSGWRPGVERGLLTPGSRGELVKMFLEWLGRRVRPSTGQPCTLRQAVRRWAFRLAAFLRGDERAYRGFVEPW